MSTAGTDLRDISERKRARQAALQQFRLAETFFNHRAAPKFRPRLPRAPTGIQGLDEITGGGLPKGRPTLVCGGAGCGKTLLAMEFLVCGVTEFNEPGVCMAFEETRGL